MLDSQLTVKQVATFSGLAERTIRRYLAEKAFETIETKGKRGRELRIPAKNALDVVLARSSGQNVSAKPTGPDLAILEALDSMKATIEAQARTIEGLRTELHDTRGQLHQMNEMIVRALPARIEDRPEPKKGFFARLFGKG